jgi:hypothetical protein
MNAQGRHYDAAYFNEAEAHWRRMVANAPDKLKQFQDCTVEGAGCVRIANYDRARFRAVFTKLAEDNGFVGKIGGPDALQAKLTAVLQSHVDNSKSDAAGEAKKQPNGNGAASANISGLITIRASDVKIQNIDFIWPGRLARGKHTMFAGEGGLGKSQMFIDITARITKGDFWPCSHDRAPVGHVIILSAEDTVADVLVPRLMSAGADLKRVTIIKSVRLDNGSERKFNLQNDLGALKNTIAEINARGDIKVALVWIDPVSSYMGTVDSHNNTALRSVLDPITDAADASSVAFASITHFNKSDSDKGIKAVHRVMGSAAFTNAPRAAFAVIKDPKDENRTLVLHLKTNIGSKQPGLAFRFGASMVGHDDSNREIWATHVLWEDKPIDDTADEVLAAAGLGKQSEPSAKDAAVEFLQQVLAKGPMDVKEIEASARAAGVLGASKPINQDKPLREAKKELCIEVVHDGHNSKWLWKLGKAPSAPPRRPLQERAPCPSEGALLPDECAKVQPSGEEYLGPPGDDPADFLGDIPDFLRRV